MNCLNRYEIQRFLDNEATTSEMAEFEEHINSCSNCRKIFTDSTDEVNTICRLLSACDLPEEEIPIPRFVNPTSKKIRRKWIIRYSIAASILMIIGTYFMHNFYSSKKQQLTGELEIKLYLYQSDPNKLWQEKQSLITITNEDGDIIYSNIND